MTVDSTTLTEKVSDYDEDGYTIVRDVIDDDLVAEARDHVEWLREQHPDKRPEQLGADLMGDDPFWVRLVSDERILDVVEEVLGPDLALFASHYIAKPPQNGKSVVWHQDGAYWPLEPMEVVTVWLSLDDVDAENGGMRVIPGTQTMDLEEMEESSEESVLSQETTADFDEGDAVDVELDPGDVSIHHPNIIHGSDGNTSDRWRRGLTIRYIPTTTTITESPWHSAFFLRGDPTTGENDYQPYPLYDPDGENLEFDGGEEYNDHAAAINERLAGIDRLVEE